MEEKNAEMQIAEPVSKFNGDDVRVITLPPATVAASHFIGDEPEREAAKMMNKFVAESGLAKLNAGMRLFGFNHPNPREGDPTNAHGYEFWATIPDGMDVPTPLAKKRFEGGMYAAYKIKMDDFHEWGPFFKWVAENDKLEYRGNWDGETMFDALEEHLGYAEDLKNGIAEPAPKFLDLLIPVQKNAKGTNDMETIAKGTNEMQKIILDVRRVGFLNDMPGDTRSPETFAFPACMTSMLECMGEDVKWQTIQAHNRDWTERFLNKEIIAATGIGFGLLWSKEYCPSSTDLTQVNADHNDTIRLAFDHAGYAFEIINKTDANKDAMRDAIIASLKAGRPVLAFGIVGPPECAIICGYDPATDSMLGWSHFQKWAKVKTAENGMFIQPDWHKENWKIVVCGEKTTPNRGIKGVIKRGLAIMESTEIDGNCVAGFPAYDEWIAYVQNADCDTMSDDKLKSWHWFHNLLIGNHAEARCYLGNYLFKNADGNEDILAAAKNMLEIHEVCWQLWGVLGGMGAPDAWQKMRDPEKRAELAALLAKIKQLDYDAMLALKRAVAEQQ